MCVFFYSCYYFSMNSRADSALAHLDEHRAKLRQNLPKAGPSFRHTDWRRPWGVGFFHHERGKASFGEGNVGRWAGRGTREDRRAVGNTVREIGRTRVKGETRETETEWFIRAGGL